MALISSESITLIVNGTLQSEFLTRFWPMRFTYSVTTGSVMNLVLFSISEAYDLPILISVSVEYQFPMPRPPISRLPTALTSSILPGFTLIFWLPTSTTFSGFTAAAGTSPLTGSVPGTGLVGALSPSTGVVPGAGCAAGVSPVTGVVPGAGCVCAGGVVAGGAAAGFGWGSDCCGADCAQAPVARASARLATVVARIATFLSRSSLLIPVSYTHLRAHETDSYL